MPEFFAGRFGSGRRGWLVWSIRWQERLACRFADHVITVSDHWRQTLIQRGVPEEKCTVVMNVADERIFAKRPKPTASHPRWHLVYHGTLTYRYGLDLVIRAVGLLREEIPEIRLTILGKGDHMPVLVELSQELALEEHVELRDELVTADELPAIIADADLGVVPYRNDVFTDGLLPTKLMEYAAMGIPCVAARTSAIEAYFRDTMVEFFTPGDAEDLARCILELRRDPDRLARLARRSRNFTRRYSWGEIGAAYAALVGRLPDRGSPSSVKG
jgi:glycosyltransferase involved in cell wall biosynthesis